MEEARSSPEENLRLLEESLLSLEMDIDRNIRNNLQLAGNY